MKIVCVGRNYVEHAKELNNEVPKDPVIFMKPKSALFTFNKPYYYPEFTLDLQYECELVLRICKNGKYIQEKFARNYFDKMTVGIDFTARDIQERLKSKGLPWEMAKAFDNSAAVGKFVDVTPETRLDNLSFSLFKDKEQVQNGNSGNMIFSIESLVSYISQYFTLNIGDLIFTGTPAGIGPIEPGETLEAYLGQEKLLELEVK